ncbi:MAG: hypothetical protein ACLPYZ_10265 [Limisphaerales bacterium]
MNGTPKTIFDHLPVYWKLSTARCFVYAFVVAIASFNAGVEGYDSFSQMTSMQVLKLFLNITAVVATTWVAFLDQTIQKLDGTKPTISPDFPADKPTTKTP